MSRGVLESLDHVVVGVNDLETATAAYAAMLGREPAWRGAHPGQGTENALFRLSNTYLELLSPAAGGDGAVGEVLRRRLAEKGEGLVALAFGTGDVGGFAARLRQAGLAAGEPAEGRGRRADGTGERTWRSVWLPGEATRGAPIFVIEHVDGRLPEGDLRCDAGEAVDGLDHVVIMTSCSDEARRFYGETLGLRLALDRVFEERGLRLLFFRVGHGATAVTVEIAGSLAERGSDAAADNLWGLAYKVADIDAAQRRLRESDFDVTEVRRGQKKGTRVFTVRSPTSGVATLFIGAEGGDG